MKRLLTTLLCMVFLAAAAIPGIAQPATGGSTRTITGKVTDNEDMPLAGVLVTASPRETATTGSDGNYTLTVTNQDRGLTFLFAGYVSRTEIIGERRVINVTLEPDATLLDDVVVVGYGVQKKVNVTGAVSSIDFAAESEGRTIVSTSAALAGLAPGLSVTQSSGQPGSDGATLRIRGEGSFSSGNNSPLVLVDGIVWSMDDVNPNDIQSISVLKDGASTAIYGSRGSRGVILITTKKGVEGKSRVSYSYKGILQMPYNKLHFVSDYARHMELMNESSENLGLSTRTFLQSSIDTWREKSLDPYGVNENGTPNYAVYPNTDWFEEIFQTGFSQEHNLTISGGSKTVSYLISGGYLDNQGVMGRFGIDSSTQKYNFRTNLEANVTDWFTAGVKVFGQRQEYGLANISNAFNSLYQTTPGVYIGEVNAWGRPALGDQESSNANNIFGMMYGSGGYNNMTRINGSAYVQIKPYKGLSFEVTGNYSPTFGERHSYGRENGYWDYTTDTRYSSSDLSKAGASNSTSRTYRLSSEILARYNTTFGEHSIGALLGYSSMEYRAWGWGVSKEGATDWSMNELNTYETITGSSNTARNGWGLRSYFGRINYSFRDRYLLEVNYRRDGSSRFGPNYHYGGFPSVSAGWKIHEENFMAGTEGWLSELKLRASWGKVGNDSMGNYTWQATYATQSVVLDGSPTKALYTESLSNENLKWETTVNTNIGVDVSFLNRKLSAEIDWYNRNTTDVLYTPDTYMTMGFASAVPSNLGKARNRGIEIALNWRSNIGRSFNYYAGVNFSYNKNLVTSFKGELIKAWTDGVYINNLADVSATYGSGRMCEGHPLGEHYLRRIYSGTGAGYSGGAVDINAGPKDGMIRTQKDMEWVQAMLDSGYKFNGTTILHAAQLSYGDLLYADSNGDGDYGNDNDMDFNGHTSTPDYTLGFNMGCSWKGLDFHMLWSGAFGFHIIWNALYYNGTQTTNGHGISQRIADDHYFFNPDDPDDPRTNLTATYPRLTFGDPRDNRLASEFYEYKGDYLKLKNVQLGYTLPERITKNFFVQQLRFFVSGENLVTITKYPGLDPEKGSTIGYPLMRSVTFGAQITF